MKPARFLPFVPILSFASVAVADITVSPGSSDPPYPGATPDPWMVSTLDPDGNFFTIDSGSQVNVSDTLRLGGRIVLVSGGLLDANQTALFDDAALTTSPSRGAAFVTGATFDAGSFTPVTFAVLYLAIDEGGVVTTDAASVIGDRSAIVIGMDDASQFMANADVTFGGDTSSFALGPSIANPADDAGDFDGTEAASNTANTWLAAAEKAKNSDAAMDAADQFENTGTIDPAVGNSVGFFVDGNATFGGANSDSLAYLGTGSSFEVTGDASFVDGGSSTADLVFLDADFTIGNDLSVARGSASSATALFAENAVSIGNNWLFGGHLGSSVANLGMFDSIVTVGDSYDALLGEGSALEITLDRVSFSTGNDFLAGAGGGSAVSTAISDSMLSGNGDYRTTVGDSSVQSFDALNTTFDFGGDFFISAGPVSTTGQSTMVTDFNNVTFTGNHFTIQLPGDLSSLASSFNETTFDLEGKFLIDGVGTLSDQTVLMTITTGDIDGDFVIGGTSGVERDTTVVISEFDPNIGGDLRFLLTAPDGSTSTLAIADFTPNVTGDVVFDVARAPGASATFSADD